MPVQDKNLILLGKILKVHGYGGEVVIGLSEFLPEELPEMEWVFIEIDKKPVPFFVSYVKDHSHTSIIVKFRYYDDSEHIREFTGCSVFTGQEKSSDENEIPHHLIFTGYIIIDQEDNTIGRVKKIMSLPMQYMLVLEGDKQQELLIPLNEDWIISLDKKNRILKMNLPDGIIQVNN